jgi:hypothetical protein
MKVIIEPMHGSFTVEFAKDGAAVHLETFSGKTSTEYHRSLPADLQFDSHKLVSASGALDFKYQVTE